MRTRAHMEGVSGVNLRRTAMILGSTGMLAGGLLTAPANATPTVQSAAAASTVPAQPPGFYCRTPYGVCRLAYPAPLGASCYCPTAYGPDYGYVV